ncbi:hypothetical protein [Streptomyces sp. ODS05-4]|uniref:hypothetical protein n=1 Tax=Streptomyces sp. ODS05-4 TaxID=2944939 RepID=UPI002109732E|nr:hypothetical protein [Streptomyces sp. ODS05-4]
MTAPEPTAGGTGGRVGTRLRATGADEPPATATARTARRAAVALTVRRTRTAELLRRGGETG